MSTASRSAPGHRELRSDAHRNREQLTRAAVTALHRDGLAVPMATIAAEAGVGVGTLYRHFPTREDLLEELTCRSFQQMLDHLARAGDSEETAAEVLRVFLTAVIRDRGDLLLPSTGGPAVQTDRGRAVQSELHSAIRAVIRRGEADGTIRRTVEVWDIAWLGATLAQPGRTGRSWDAICLRLLDTYLAGLAVP